MNQIEMEKVISDLQERVAMLEFREELGRDGSNVSDVLIDYNINRDQYRRIMDIMDNYREKIDNGKEVSNAQFENDIINIFGGSVNAAKREQPIEYHFCEYIAKAFMDDRRWEEVFPALYGDMPKYSYLKGNGNGQ